MPEETIAEYRWRIPTDEWSNLCDNVLQLDRSTGLPDAPFRLNSLAICSPPCEMCVTAREPDYCDPVAEVETVNETLESFALEFCELLSRGDVYRIGFTGSAEFVFEIPENMTRETAVQRFSEEITNFIGVQGADGFWEGVSTDASEADSGILVLNYNPELTGASLELLFTRA